MKSYLKKQIFVAGCAYIGQILVGYSLGWTAPIIPKLQDPAQTPLPAVINDNEASLIGSVLYIGCITGPYLTGYLSNFKGRKVCLLISALSSLLSFTVISIGRNLAMVFAARMFMGVAVGIIFVINLVYIGEIASTNIRGILLSATGIFGTLGTLIIYSVGPYVSYAATGYIGLAITIVYLIGIYFMPETPMFYVINGNDEKAKRALDYLHRSEDIDSVVSSRKDVQESRLKDWKEILSVKNNRKALFITVTLNVLQQMSGVIPVLFFATTIFELAESNIEPEIATIIIGVTQLVSSVVSPVFIDKSGRRVLLLFSTAICCLSLASLGTYFYFNDNNYNMQNFQWLPLATLIVFFMSYDMGFCNSAKLLSFIGTCGLESQRAVGVGTTLLPILTAIVTSFMRSCIQDKGKDEPVKLQEQRAIPTVAVGFGIIPSTFIGEMFAPNVRSPGSTVTITIAWLFGFFVTSIYGYIFTGLGGHGTFWIFSGACGVAFFFTLFLVPETKQKSLAEIQEMLSK